MPPSAPLSLASSSPQNDSAISKPDTEKELKIVTVNGSNEPFKLFAKELEKQKVPGIEILQTSEPQRLIARQLDTHNKDLLKNGISLRIRGTYIGSDEEGYILTPDINIKTPKMAGELGMSRGEYEANISDAGTIDLGAIERNTAKNCGPAFCRILKWPLR